jgi:hypothetical protein
MNTDIGEQRYAAKATEELHWRTGTHPCGDGLSRLTRDVVVPDELSDGCGIHVAPDNANIT